MSMTDEIRLQDARVLIVDPQAHARQLLNDALHMIGFRAIDGLDNVADLKPAMDSIDPDIVFIDIDQRRPIASEAIRNIRAKKLGPNPFVIVVALTWHPDRDAVRDMLSSGIDDIIAKPVSAAILQERTANLIENRKDFIVTADYVGPDRRAARRPPSANDLPAIQVPNSLRHAVMGDTDAVVDEDSIAKTMRSLCAQKIYRLATEISETGLDLVRQCEAVPEAPLPHISLGKIGTMIEEIQTLVGEHDFASILRISESTRAILAGILAEGSKAEPRQLELLHLHGQAIAVTLRSSAEAAGALVTALNEAAMVVNG